MGGNLQKAVKEPRHHKISSKCLSKHLSCVCFWVWYLPESVRTKLDAPAATNTSKVMETKSAKSYAKTWRQKFVSCAQTLGKTFARSALTLGQAPWEHQTTQSTESSAQLSAPQERRVAKRKDAPASNCTCCHIPNQISHSFRNIK